MSYEQDRDEAGKEYIKPNTFPVNEHKEWAFKSGADWANDRAEKVIADLKVMNAAQGNEALRLNYEILNLSQKLASRDAMIEKLEILLKREIGYTYKIEQHTQEIRVTLAELNEWKKIK